MPKSEQNSTAHHDQLPTFCVQAPPFQAFLGLFWKMQLYRSNFEQLVIWQPFVENPAQRHPTFPGPGPVFAVHKIQTWDSRFMLMRLRFPPFLEEGCKSISVNNATA